MVDFWSGKGCERMIMNDNGCKGMINHKNLYSLIFLCFLRFFGAQNRNRTGTAFSSRRILSPLCLPISPPGRMYGGASQSRTGLTGFAIRGITDLLTHHVTEEQKGKHDAFPRMWSGKRGSNSRPIPWQGIALPAELFPHVLHKN